jgi:xanthine dehydrogenase accessory factor
MDATLLKEVNRLRTARKAVAVLTDIGTGSGRLIERDTAPGDPLADILADAFRSGRSRIVDLEGKPHFLNVHLPSVRIVVIGAVHISQVLAPMARMTGFDATVIDPRTAFATTERFAGTELIAEWPDEVLASRPLDAYTALVAVTHDPKIDDGPLKAALEAGCFYVGALGSRKTHAARCERLGALGLPKDTIERIAAPVGVDIGAATPAEIAVAILAQIIERLRKTPSPTQAG